MSHFPPDAVPEHIPHTLPDIAAQDADSVFDLLVIGAGPTGLACAIEAQRAGFRVAAVDKGCVCNSLFHYPAHMTFFTTSELLEIGDIPFPSPNAKPSRNEALEYYRQVAGFYKLDVRQYQRVERIEPFARFRRIRIRGIYAPERRGDDVGEIGHCAEMELVPARGVEPPTF